MKISLVVAALLVTGCGVDAVDRDLPAIAGPVVSQEVCRDGCSADLQAQIDASEFDQVLQPGGDSIFFIEQSQLGDVCSHLVGDCARACQPAALESTRCRVLRCDLDDGRLMVGRLCQ